MNRRTFLKVSAIGTGAIAIAGVGRAQQVGLLGSADAYEAWTDVAHERGVRAIVAAGVLAANPHNSQPWQFHLDETHIGVYLDLARSLGAVDPVLRQMHLGIGCALENLIVSATSQGLAASGDVFPDPRDPTLAVRLTLSATGSPVSRHVEAIARRHTNRGPYDPSRPIPTNVEASLRGQAHHADTTLELFEVTSSAGRIFSRAVLQSTEALIADDVFMRATDAWFRWTPREVRDHRDGPALDAAGLPSVKRIAAQLAPRPSLDSYHRSWLDSTRDVHLATAASFGVIAVRDPTSPSQLVEAGRLWQRLHLEATLHGLGMQPLDQWLELVDRSRQRDVAGPATLGTAIVGNGHVAVMMFRCGIPLRAATPSARRHLDDVLIS